MGGSFSQGEGISHSAQVTGTGTTAGGVNHAFLYSGGSVQDLGSVGTYKSSIERAFVFDGAAMRDLNDLLDGSGASRVLHAANDINDPDQIVGYGTHNGVVRPFLLTPVPSRRPGR